MIRAWLRRRRMARSVGPVLFPIPAAARPGDVIVFQSSGSGEVRWRYPGEPESALRPMPAPPVVPGWGISTMNAPRREQS